ncbi:MAG TPA: c-type cytochrome, partial [Gemmataceae bacterium]|nr:c-type cytochrome [Gemmataceae bacterium]
MPRELIEGAAFLPPQALKTVDPSAGVDMGRIWRIVPENFKRPAPPKLSRASTAELVQLLDHPNGWYRDTASRLLYERQDKTAAGALAELAEKAKSAQGRVHALYALAGLKKLDVKLIRKAFLDPEPRVREHAIRLCETRFGGFQPPPYQGTDGLWELRRDPDPNVRIQLAYSLHRVGPPGQNENVEANSAAVYLQLALRDIGDPWMRLALLTGIDPVLMWRVVRDNAGGGLGSSQYIRSQPDGPAFLIACAEIMAADNDGNQASQLFQTISDMAFGTRTARADPPLARAVLRAAMTRGSVQTQAFFNDANNEANVKLVRDALMTDAVRTARDPQRPVAARVAAIRDLPMLPFRDAYPVLADTIKASEPPAVQAATLDALGKYADDGVPTVILAAWKAMTPPVRATATEVLLSRNNGAVAFLDAVEAKTVARGDVDPARVALLKKSPARNIGLRAAKLFAAPADRQKVFEAYRSALERKGDPLKGKAVFKAHCSACHKLEGVGEEVGADIRAIRDRGLEAVLLNIIDPNREVKPQFLTYAAELKSGRVVTGLVTAETATGLTIRRADGISESIGRSEVETLRSLGTSYMPEGLERQIDVAAMADLLAYLNSIK